MADGEVVLVTGGAGFLGQHVVKLLHDDDKVSLIRILDIKPYQKKLEYDEKKPVKSFVADICDLEACKEAFKGVHVVIHLATVVSFGVFPEKKRMEEVNVKGTKNVIQLCREEGVSRMVFTSTVDVVGVPGRDLIYTREVDAPPPQDRKFCIQDYSDTKLRAEELVEKADNAPLDNKNEVLRTVILRPTVLYGEGDPYFIKTIIERAKESGNVLQRFGGGETFCQPTYVGNAAWSVIKAKDSLKSNVDEVGGEVVFVTDDTTPKNTFTFAEPFLKLHDCRLSSWALPYWFTYYTVSLLAFVSRLIGKELVPSAPGEIAMICTTIYLNRLKARLRLDYIPKYNEEESMEMASKYYATLK